GVRAVDAHDHPQRGGLAAAVGADESVNAAVGDCDGDRIHRHLRSKRLCDTAQLHGVTICHGHAAFTLARRVTQPTSAHGTLLATVGQTSRSNLYKEAPMRN